MSIKTGMSSTSTDSNSTSSALSPLSADGSLPVVDSPAGIAVPTPAAAPPTSAGAGGVGVGMGTGTADELNRRSVGLEKDLEALDLKAGSERQSNGNELDVGKEDDGSFDDSDPERQLRRYARDLTRYHRNLFDGVKTREQRKKS